MLYQKSIDCYLVTSFPIFPCTTMFYQKSFSSTFPSNLVPIEHFLILSIHFTCNQVKYHINFDHMCIYRPILQFLLYNHCNNLDCYMLR